MAVDERAFFLYTYILLWRHGQVVKTSASQAEIEGSTPSGATKHFMALHRVAKTLCSAFSYEKSCTVFHSISHKNINDD